jgi:hypothetical protein
MTRHPIEFNFYVEVSEAAIEVVFAPTRIRYTYSRLGGHEPIANLLSPHPMIRHPQFDTGDYPPGEVQAMAYRVALATARRLRQSAKRPASQ